MFVVMNVQKHRSRWRHGYETPWIVREYVVAGGGVSSTGAVFRQPQVYSARRVDAVATAWMVRGSRRRRGYESTTWIVRA